MLTSSDHTGLITDFQYWADHKLLLSAGNDGLIMVWGSGGNCMDKIRVSLETLKVLNFKNNFEIGLFYFLKPNQLFRI